MKHLKRIIGVLSFLLLIKIISLTTIADEIYLDNYLRFYLRKDLHGDVLVINLVASGEKLVLKNPITLRSPYFNEVYGQYGQLGECKPIIESANHEALCAFEREVACMVFSRDGVVLFVPQESCMQWDSTRGYAAIMQQSDIISWAGIELQKKAFERKLDERGAHVWSLPLLKDKYLKKRIFWQSEETWRYALSFFKEAPPSEAKCGPWRLFSIFGECHGW